MSKWERGTTIAYGVVIIGTLLYMVTGGLVR